MYIILHGSEKAIPVRDTTETPYEQAHIGTSISSCWIVLWKMSFHDSIWLHDLSPMRLIGDSQALDVGYTK